jgi:PAS domain S-box-containing protein
MTQEMRFLIVEDLPTDAALLEREVRKTIPESVFSYVETQDDFISALENFRPDFILSDYEMPRFDGLTALRIAAARQPDIPFIIVTGSRNEETAVECMKAGAWNYIIKERIRRLGPALETALQEKQRRGATRRAYSQKEAAVEMLHKSEDRFRLLFMTMREGMALHYIVFSPEGLAENYIIQDVNPAWEKMLGISREKAIGKLATDLYGTVEPPYLKEYAQVAESGSAIGFETYFEPNKKWYDISAFTPAKGTFATVFLDITGRKQSEEALRCRERDYASLAENAPDMIERYDTQRRCVFVNTTAERMLGLPPEMFLGKTPMEVSERPATQGNFIDQTLRQVIERQEGVEVEQAYPTSSGMMLLHTHAVPELDANGKLESILVITRDVTEFRKKELRLRERETELQTIFDVLPVGVSVMNDQRKILELNPALESMLQLTKAEINEGVLNKRKYLHPDGSEMPPSELANNRAKAELGLVRDVETGVVMENGTIRWMSVSAAPLPTNGVVIATIDITERKRMEEALRIDEIRYRALVENMNDVVYSVDTEAKFTYVSPVAKAVFGYDPKDIVGRGFDTIIYPDDLAAVRSAFADILSGQVYPSEYRALTKKGEIRWIRTSSRPVYEDGKIVGLQGIASDITQRKHAEEEREEALEALWESEERFRETFEQASIGVAHVGLDGKWLRVNWKLCEIAGYTRTELLQKKFGDITHPDDRPADLIEAQQLLDGKKTSSIREKRYIHKDGHAIWVRISVSLVHTPSKDQDYFAAFTEDITEWKKTEEEKNNALGAMRQSEDRFRTLIEQAPVAISVSRSGIGLYANSKFAQMVGIENPEELIGRYVATYFAPAYQEESRERSKRRANGQPVANEFESIARRVDGQEFPVRVLVDEVRLRDGMAYIAFVTNIAEEKRIQHQREEALAALSESEQNFRLLSENALDGILIASGNGETVYTNKQFSKLMGFTTVELLSRTIRDLASPDQVETVLSRFHDRISGKDVSTHFETVIVRKDGSYMPVELAATSTIWKGQPSVMVFINDISERKLVEDQKMKALEALRQSEERFRATFEQAAIGIAHVAPGGVWLTVNQKLCDIAGFTHEEFLQKSYMDLMFPEDREIFIEASRKLVSGELATYYSQNRYRRENGSAFWVNLTLALVHKPNGEPDYFVVVAEDITERKLIEAQREAAVEALRANETRYRALVETSPDGITLSDTEGKIVMCNRQSAALGGFHSMDEMIGKSAFELIAPDFRDIALLNMYRTLEEGTVHNLQYDLLHQDGSRFAGEMSTSVIRDEKGAPTAFMAITRDISERVRAEKALQESEALYRTLLGTSPDAITITDLQGRITLANQQTAIIHRYASPEEMIGINSFDLIAPEEVAAAAASMQTVLEKGIEHDVEYLALRKDGTRFPLNLSSAVLKDPSGEPKGFIAVTRDITEQKLAQGQREDALKALSQSEQRFRVLIENGFDCIALIDSTGCIVYESPSNQRVSGYTIEERTGKNAFELVHPDDRDGVLSIMKKVIGEKGGTVTHIFRSHNKKGDWQWLEAVATNMLNDVAVRAIVVNYRDISARQSAEMEVRRLNEELEKRVQDRTRELSALYESARIGNEEDILMQYLQRVLPLILKTVHFPVGVIYLVDEKGKQMRQAASEGFFAGSNNAAEVVPIDQGLIGQVVKKAEPLILVDAKKDARHRSRQPLMDEFPVFYGIPLITKRKVLGVLAISGKTGQNLNTESLALLTTMADQIAEAVGRDRLRLMASQALILEERHRLARELHDSLTQSMYAIANYSTAAKDQLKASHPVRALEHLEKTEQVAHQGLREMRLLVFELRPSSLEEGGLANALHERLDVVEKHAGMRTKLTAKLARNLPPEMERELYGIAMEALNNTLKHAEASEVKVRISGGLRGVTLEVADNGKGIRKQHSPVGVGLTTMRERSKVIGGKFELESEKGKGTIIRVTVPTEQKPRAGKQIARPKKAKGKA